MQRHLLHIVVLLLVVTAVSCTRTSRHPQLVAADSLLLSQPDSALVLLRSMHFTSESDRMYHTLLLADACNKCYDTLPSDSLLREVADFYDSHGTPNEQVRAHYLLGCAYRDLGEAPQALDCYHDAIDHADTLAKDCNYRLLMSVYGQMANIFDKQNLPKNELEALRMSGHFALLSKDTLLYIRSMELEVKPYNLLGDTAKVFEITENTKTLYREYGYPYMAIRENGLLCSIYLNRGDLAKAHELLEEFEEGSGLFDGDGNIGEDRQIYYDIKGRYFIKTNQLDSAEYYMRKLLKHGYDAQAYRGLITICQQRGKTDSIVKLIHEYEAAADSSSNRLRTEVVGQMSSMYNYHRFEKIAEREERAATRMRRTIFLMLFVSVVIAFLLYWLYRVNKRKRQLETEQLKLNYVQAKADYGRKEEELRLLMTNNEQLQHIKEQEIEQLRNAIAGYKEKLLSVNVPEEHTNKSLEIIVRFFRQRASGMRNAPAPSKREWKELIRAFKINMPAEQLVVCSEGLLATNEQRTCILLLLGFSNNEVATLLETTPQRVSNIKSRINRKLFHDDSASTFQANLKYLSLNV